MIENLHQKLTQAGSKLQLADIANYVDSFEKSQKYFPKFEQYALMINLIEKWKKRKKEKILIIPTEYKLDEHYPFSIVFGIISSDWPGLSDSCIGVIHEKGWNVYFAIGVTLNCQDKDLGIILVSVLVEDQEKYLELKSQEAEIINDIKKASVGNITKVYLLAEEIKKLQIYSSVIDKVEELYKGKNLDKLIGIDGEAVRFFAARSREYVENRSTTDIAWQIIINQDFREKIKRLRQHMQVDIHNFPTKKEGEFTGITIAGMTNQFSLDALLRAIEHACPGFQLKHHKDYTTEDGINVHRFEIVTQTGIALNPSQTKMLNEIFKNLESSKRRERQNWLESIGGFEHYARAIIPFLMKQNKLTGQNQIYISVLQSTETIIDFKILIVLTPQKVKTNKLMYQCIHKLDSNPGFYISKIKPPSRYGDSEVIIMDLKVDLTVHPDIEKVYQKSKRVIEEHFGKSKDFDEGMRQMDLRNFQNVQKHLSSIKEATLREFYYSLEDFYRVTAPVEEIAAQILLGLEIQSQEATEKKNILVLSQNLVPENSTISPASIIVISYPSEKEYLKKMLGLFEDYETIMSKLEKDERHMLICRLSKNRQALKEAELQKLVNKLKNQP